jgi:hypothetical protein
MCSFNLSSFTCFGLGNRLQKGIINTYGNYYYNVIGHYQYLQKLLLQCHRNKILFCDNYYEAYIHLPLKRTQTKLVLDFNSVHTGSGAHPASYPMDAWHSFPGAKRLESEADHSPYLVPRSRKVELYLHSFDAASWHCLLPYFYRSAFFSIH